ncbi:MAG: ion channel [Reyranellaceae bacterium]
MLLAMVAATVLAGICLLMHYEALRRISLALPRITFMPPRLRLLAAMVGIMVAHTVEIWMFAGAFWALERWIGLGGFDAQIALSKDFAEYVYFSTVSYTSLGLGDIYPTGGMRLVTGAEALIGLLMIGWSASFAYLMMVDLWPLHRKHGPRH